ncbi:MAG: PKD domain-containing protein, partial [Bacteroidota bacterium]
MKRRTQNVRNSLTHKHIGSKTQRLMLLLLCCIVFNIQQALACYYPPTSIGYLCDGCLVGEQIVFSGDLSHGNGDLPYLQDPQWIWDFGDGSSGSGPYPEHTYTQAGTYTVSLVYYDCKGWAGNLCTFQITIDSPPSCTVSPTSVSFGSSGGTQSISVTLTNITGWGVGANQSWTVVSPTGGYNSGSFTITCSANTSTSTRSGSVTVYSAGGPRTISVTQAGIPQYTLTYSTVSQGRLQGASPQTVTYGSSGTAVMVVSSGGPYHF